MGGHQVRHQVLLFPDPFIHPVKLPRKLFVHSVLRFPHQGKHRRGHVLRSYFQLPAYMVFTEFFQKILLLICKQIVETDTGADEDFFYLRDRSQFFQ